MTQVHRYPNGLTPRYPFGVPGIGGVMITTTVGEAATAWDTKTQEMYSFKNNRLSSFFPSKFTGQCWVLTFWTRKSESGTLGRTCRENHLPLLNF